MEGIEAKGLEVSCSFEMGGIWCIFFIKDPSLERQIWLVVLGAINRVDKFSLVVGNLGLPKHTTHTHIANAD